jgi:hypothetical protein
LPATSPRATVPAPLGAISLHTGRLPLTCRTDFEIVQMTARVAAVAKLPTHQGRSVRPSTAAPTMIENAMEGLQLRTFFILNLQCSSASTHALWISHGWTGSDWPLTVIVAETHTLGTWALRAGHLANRSGRTRSHIRGQVGRWSAGVLGADRQARVTKVAGAKRAPSSMPSRPSRRSIDARGRSAIVLRPACDCKRLSVGLTMVRAQSADTARG